MIDTLVGPSELFSRFSWLVALHARLVGRTYVLSSLGVAKQRWKGLGRVYVYICLLAHHSGTRGVVSTMLVHMYVVEYL